MEKFNKLWDLADAVVRAEADAFAIMLRPMPEHPILILARRTELNEASERSAKAIMELDRWMSGLRGYVEAERRREAMRAAS